MSSFPSRFAFLCARAIFLGAFVGVPGLGTAFAAMIPTTSATVTALTGGTAGAFFDMQQNINQPGPTLASVSVGGAAGSDGSTSAASASAVANFGALGVMGGGSGSTPPIISTTGVSSDSTAFASWDDFFTAVPNGGSPLAPGAPVVANLNLDLSFTNTLEAINNAVGTFSYDVFIFFAPIDPVTGLPTNPLLIDDCLSFNPDPESNFCDAGSHFIGIPADTNGQHLTAQLGPIALQVAILQPFELSVGVTFEGQCTSGPNPTAVSSCTFVGDALHTSNAFLQPLGDFTLIAASGHVYAPGITPPGSVPEPASLALILTGLVPAALWLRRRPTTRSGAARGSFARPG